MARVTRHASIFSKYKRKKHENGMQANFRGVAYLISHTIKFVLEVELQMSESDLTFAISITYNPVCILAIPFITFVLFCKIWQESEVNCTKLLLDNANLGMDMRLTWNKEIYNTRCNVRVG